MILSTLTLLAAVDMFDVCVIGAGPVGLALGLSLARNFRRVLLLESGGEEPDFSASELFETELADPRSHARPSDFSRRGLGGTSRVWGAGCTPYDPIDFRSRPYVPLSGAPVSIADVARYHAQACDYFGCGGPEFDLGEDPPGSRLHRGGVIRFAAQPDMGKRHRAELEASPYLWTCLGSTATRLHLDAGSGEITAVEVRSGDQTTVVRAPAFVLACGGIEAARLLLRVQTEHPAFLGGPAGPLGRYYMGHVAGHLARVHFDERTMGRDFSFLRSEAGTYFRRRITFAPEVLDENQLLNIYFVPGNFPLEDAGMKSGALSALHLGLSARHHTLQYMRHYLPGYIAGPPGNRVNVGRHLLNILTDPVGTGVGLAEILHQRAERAQRPPGLYYPNPRQIFALRYHSEQLPNPDSRVTLSERRDANGVPLPRVDLRFTDADIDSVVAAHNVLDRLVRDERWGHLSWMCAPSQAASHVRSQARDGYHQIGLTRMSDSPRDGVVDSNLAVHGVRNLWVASTGVLPTGSQAHPTFAAVALALRLAEHLSARSVQVLNAANL